MLVDYFELIKSQMRVDQLFGAEHIAASYSKSRIVWVPSEDGVGPAKPRINQTNPKVTLNREAGVDLYIFGVDNLKKEDKLANHRATEALLDEVLAVIHEECIGNVGFEKVRWGLRQQDQWMTFGGACILPVYFDVPVCAKPQRTAKPTDMEPTDNEFSQEI
jgi:hypothetical protein